MKKLLLILCFMITIMPAVSAETAKGNVHKSKQCECVSKTDELLKRINDEKAVFANALTLTPCQAKFKEDLDKQRFVELDLKFNELTQEQYALKVLEKSSVSKETLKKQQKLVKQIEHDIKSIKNKYDREFYSSLTCLQKTKYKELKKLTKRDIRKCKKGKKLYKQDPNLLPFGVRPTAENCGCKKCPVKKLRSAECGCGKK